MYTSNMEKEKVCFILYFDGYIKEDCPDGYFGGKRKSIVVSRTIKFSDLLNIIHRRIETSPSEMSLSLKCHFPIDISHMTMLDVMDDEDLPAVMQLFSNSRSPTVGCQYMEQCGALEPDLSSEIPMSTDGIDKIDTRGTSFRHYNIRTNVDGSVEAVEHEEDSSQKGVHKDVDGSREGITEENLSKYLEIIDEFHVDAEDRTTGELKKTFFLQIQLQPLGREKSYKIYASTFKGERNYKIYFTTFNL
ncbi:uncharacterized protein LOC143864870 [Tasmannia lanceolata]|uniref:uncharacterized protein LOC143864870 n=1 Tax=Tasmannia lanceolata TaxID=3420 RepID=UPI0040636CE2